MFPLVLRLERGTGGVLIVHPDVKPPLWVAVLLDWQNIRTHYIEELGQLGFIHTTQRCVHTEWSNSPLYDVILASRKNIAVKLFEAANRKRQPSQLGLLDVG